MVTLIIVKTWSRLLISNYAWHLPGCCGLPFSCLLLGRVIEDGCLVFLEKEAFDTQPACLFHSVLGDLLLPKEKRQKGLPQQVGGPKGGSQNRVPFATYFCFYCPFLPVTTSALQKSLSLEQLTGRRDLLECDLCFPYWRTGS